MLAYYQGDYEYATMMARECLALFRELGEKQGIATSLNALALITRMKGDNAAARALQEESLAIFRELGDKWSIAQAIYLLGSVASYQGDDTTTRSLMQEGLALFREVGDQQGIANSLGVLGLVAFSQGDYEAARAPIEEALAIFRVLDDRRGISRGLHGLASIAFRRGDYERARTRYEESLAIVIRELDDKWNIAACLEGLGYVAAAQRQPLQAARFWGAAESLRETIGAPVPPFDRANYEHMVTSARRQLSEDNFATAWMQGRTMTPEQVLAAQERGTKLMKAPLADTHPPVIPQDGLTTREVEVLRLVARGLTDQEVADSLVVSTRTINAHLRSIYTKLGVTTRTAATRYAFDHQLV
jgi:ATP/maltotriose-dependent transcriptional regulator MalT